MTRPENYPLLHQNGRIIYLSRDLSLLETNGRPLSEQEGIVKLYAVRRPMYESFADFTVKNDGTVEETARRILQSLGTDYDHEDTSDSH